MISDWMNRNGKLRLGDFWRLELLRQQSTDLERIMLKQIRKTRFREKSCCSDPADALSYLQTEVSNCINHQNTEEQREYQLLASQIFNQVMMSRDELNQYYLILE